MSFNERTEMTSEHLHSAFGISKPAPIIRELPTPELLAERAEADPAGRRG